MTPRHGKKKRDLEVLSVEVRTDLRCVPQDEIMKIMFALLMQPEQTLKKRFIVRVEDLSHSANQNEIDWVEVGGLDRKTPGVGVSMKLGISGSDDIWDCRLMIPDCIAAKQHVDFLQTIKQIGLGFSKNRKPHDPTVDVPLPSDVGVEEVGPDTPPVDFPEANDEQGQINKRAGRVRKERRPRVTTAKCFDESIILEIAKRSIEKAGASRIIYQKHLIELMQNLGMKCNMQMALVFLIKKKMFEKKDTPGKLIQLKVTHVTFDIVSAEELKKVQEQQRAEELARHEQLRAEEQARAERIMQFPRKIRQLLVAARNTSCFSAQLELANQAVNARAKRIAQLEEEFSKEKSALEIEQQEVKRLEQIIIKASKRLNAGVLDEHIQFVDSLK